MLDFQAYSEKKITLSQLTEGVDVDSLRRASNESVDTILGLIANCTDADVVFTPVDPQANDTFAADAADANLPWSLGHLIVHSTASAEEAAALAAEQARGVEHHGRSRYETPWQTVTTIAQCRERLEESRQMRLASLGMWPAVPHMENIIESNYFGTITPIGRFVLGLTHEFSHLAQIAEVVRQAQAARI